MVDKGCFSFCFYIYSHGRGIIIQQMALEHCRHLRHVFYAFMCRYSCSPRREPSICRIISTSMTSVKQKPPLHIHYPIYDPQQKAAKYTIKYNRSGFRKYLILLRIHHLPPDILLPVIQRSLQILLSVQRFLLPQTVRVSDKC